jgi:hypothetical protein
MYDDRLTAQQEWTAAYYEYLEDNEFFDYCAGDALFCRHCCDWRDAI